MPSPHENEVVVQTDFYTAQPRSPCDRTAFQLLAIAFVLKLQITNLEDLNKSCFRDIICLIPGHVFCCYYYIDGNVHCSVSIYLVQIFNFCIWKYLIWSYDMLSIQGNP